MKVLLRNSLLCKDNSLIWLVIGSEERCLASLSIFLEVGYRDFSLLLYEPLTAQAKRHLADAKSLILSAGGTNTTHQLNEDDPERSIKKFDIRRVEILSKIKDRGLFLDISVLNKLNLVVLMRWFDMFQIWDYVDLVYTEAKNYLVSDTRPMSTGIKSIYPFPGFPSVHNLGRPIHLTLILGLEANRAWGAYSHSQPSRTTLLLPEKFHQDWGKKTEKANKDLISLIGNKQIVSAIDPELVSQTLESVIGLINLRSEHINYICPLGTKPETVGVFMYHRKCLDPPLLLYVHPAHRLYERSVEGIGQTWLIKGRTIDATSHQD